MQNTSYKARTLLTQKEEHTVINDTNFIDFTIIINTIRSYWTTLLGCIALMVVCAAVAYAIVPFRWQASTILLIGQMPMGASVGGANEIALIEPPIQAAERLKLRETENKILTLMGRSLDEYADDHTALFRNSLNATIIKNTNFVRVNVGAFSPEEAQKNLVAATRTLIELHDLRMAPIIKRLAEQLQHNMRQITEAEAERARMQTLLADAGKPTSAVQFAPGIVAVSLLDNKIAEIRKLMAERAVLEDMMGPTKTFPTAVVDAVHVDANPYFPKRSVFLGTGALLGILLGFGMIMYRNRQP